MNLKNLRTLLTINFRVSIAFAAVALGTPKSGAQNAVATIGIHADKPLHSVSPTLYGLMTEEINYSYDGGLYAEMVRNRTFEDHDWSGVAHWDTEHMGNSAASMTIDLTDGPSEAQHHSLLLDIKHADSANPAGIRNEGYWGMAVRPNTDYSGSFYSKTDAADMGPLSVSLVDDRTGKTLAATTVSGVSQKWAQCKFVLTTGAIEATSQAHLLLTVGHAGKL
jgi:alpha-L-arabinofuranosidase